MSFDVRCVKCDGSGKIAMRGSANVEWCDACQGRGYRACGHTHICAKCAEEYPCFSPTECKPESQFECESCFEEMVWGSPVRSFDNGI